VTESPPQAVTLENCDREPIHIPGSIQGHGALLALEEPSLKVLMASANTADLLGVAHEELVGQTLEAVLTADSTRLVAEVREQGSLRDHNPLKLVGKSKGRVFDGILHRSSGALIVELEPATTADDLSFGQFYRRVRRSVARLRETQRVMDLADLAAQEVRKLTGFDRVMVYRFAPDASGEVIAEAKRDGLESYLGLHYPASDIPAQARRLYTVNWLRLIADVSYRPVPILPSANPLDKKPLDLSHSVLRSVSPIHVEYLTNMGVKASMSISLVLGDSLWGLVACHHYSPYFVAYEVRAASEFLGEALSWQIAARERADTFESRAQAQRVLAKLVERMSASPHPTLDLAGPDSPLPALVNATAAAVHCGGKLTTTGPTPSEKQLRAFVEWLPSVMDDRPLLTESLQLDHPSAPELGDVAGVLVVPISTEQRHFVMWFRPEVERTINWGGNPEKNVELRDGVPRLSPRGSFALWKETVRNHSAPWLPHHAEVAQELIQGISGGIEQRAAELAKLNEELRASNFAKDEFLATVSHELRTPLNAMLGWLALLESGELPLSKRDRAMETVTRNARVQAQLVEDLLDVSRIISGKMRLDVQPVEPLEVVEAAIATVQPAADAKGIRIQPVLDPNAGPVMGDPSRLQQVLWNLLTNAVKFTPRDGRIQVRLQRVESSIEIGVSDSGTGIKPEFLPHVFDRFRQSNGTITRSHKGLGLGLSIVKHLVELHGGQVSVASEGESRGATFTVRLPIAALRPPAPERSPAPSQPKATTGSLALLEAKPELSGLRMLVVDDEPDARELVTTLLEGNGVEVTAAGSAPEALQLIPRILPDILISDIGMPNMDGYELVQKLRRLPSAQGGRTVAVALTAFARSEDRSRAFLSGFDMYLPKPVDPAELMALVVNLSHRLRGPQEDGRNAPASESAPSARLPAVVLPLTDLNVLLVDADSDTRAELVRTLASAGALVSVAASTEQALRQFEALNPDVLVCGSMLPVGEAASLLRELRLLNGHRTTPAIALTRNGDKDEAAQAILAGFQAHLPLAAAPNELVAKVAKLSAWSYRRTQS
jgi:light-regulated signal transduction histidine kinase (bacteriophytochrome)/CheY-like chemotaxis protein